MFSVHFPTLQNSRSPLSPEWEMLTHVPSGARHRQELHTRQDPCNMSDREAPSIITRTPHQKILLLLCIKNNKKSPGTQLMKIIILWEREREREILSTRLPDMMYNVTEIRGSLCWDDWLIDWLVGLFVSQFCCFSNVYIGSFGGILSSVWNYFFFLPRPKRDEMHKCQYHCIAVDM